MDAETTAEAALKRLGLDAVNLIAASGRPVEEFRGVALFSSQRDEQFQSLATFPAAREAVEVLPEASVQYAVEEANRLVLQFIYALVRHPGCMAEPEVAVDDIWQSFREEAAIPFWTFGTVANLEFFELEDSGAGFIAASGQESDAVSLGNGVLVVGRSTPNLMPLGCDEHIMERLFEDWSGFGVSSFVIVAQTSQEKSPENLILSGDGQAQLAAIRAVLAMRLVAGGHVGTGHMFLMRPALFNVGIGGVTRSGWPRPPVYGPRYTLTPALIEPIVRLSGQLQALESTPSTGPGNLPLALRYFSESYERRSPTDAVVDLVTALEAVLGTETEISYRLSTRVAHLLASTEDERVHLFRTTKLWYDLRSAVVHGSRLKLKHQSLLADPEPLRQIVRRLLRGFIELAMQNDSPYGKQFFAEELESTLLSESKRALLQSAMRLNE